ncbi:coiled-coil domain-containing protein 174 [Aphidius gifuensis]|uniref:coiled-coil domain-containing protein 174 n=1 Tax=Aphidius gifuensis TaxID=684658 RepID=UPI001CDC03E0|nr:coiled-coil domain-containing protein 174 [Aphidius gifuensis]
MNNSKKISVNYSSLIGLKAELLRKKAEIDDAKSSTSDTTKTTLKPKIKSKKKTIKKEKKDDKNDDPIELEDVSTLKKSKYMLEAKSRLYEKLKKNGDKDQMYLVDFSNKSESEDEVYNDDDYDDDDVNSDPEEDWIDYTDCFGRTRRCLRRDLPKMKEKDNLVKQEVVNEPPEDAAINKQDDEQQQPDFIAPPNETEIELMRKKWEEQTEKLSHKPDIHYQDILFDEARTHGVGYYAFSQDDEERKKQQENLLKLRKETEQKQKEMLETKELKEKIENNRLKAARIRKRIRAGLPAEPEEEEEAAEKEEPPKHLEDVKLLESPIAIADDSKKSKEPNEKNSLIEIEDKVKAFGELLGKRPKFRELSQEEWIHKRRKDRLNEFAPVYDNFKSGGHLKATRHNQIITSDNSTIDPIRINTGGPEPTDMWECQSKEEQSDDEIDSNFVGPVPPPSTVTSFDSSNPVLIPPIEILRSVPPPSINSTISSQLFCPQNAVIAEASDDDEDSDDSDIIGPMPPPSINVDSVFDIPLPAVPPPPPSSSLNTDNQTLDDDKISAGLKFLRQKFDKNENN